MLVARRGTAVRGAARLGWARQGKATPDIQKEREWWIK